MSAVRLTPHRFARHDLVAGHPCLDWVNTVTARDTEPHDWIVDFQAWLHWAQISELLSAADLRALGQKAAEDPAGARRALRRAKGLRELLHRLFSAFVEGEKPAPKDLAELDGFRIAAHRRARAFAGRDGVQLSLDAALAGCDLITDVLALDAVAVLSNLPRDRFRVCPGCDCGWLFHDTSKGGQRRWCDMSTCGSVEKARRHRKATRNA